MSHMNTILLNLLFAVMFMDLLSWKETIITTNLCTLEWLTGFSDICKWVKIEKFVFSFAVYIPYHSWWDQLGVYLNLIFLSLFLLSLKQDRKSVV
jgi:hypothetical protein